MLSKLLALYKNAFLLPNPPDQPLPQYLILYHAEADKWIGIPKMEISKQEITLLKTLFELVEYQSSASSATDAWYRFLFLDGPMPPNTAEAQFRFIQFQINGEEVDQREVESALKGFFIDDVIIVWESKSRGMVIEEKKQISLSEEELISISETLESDFYVKISFYIGRLYPVSEQLPVQFKQEMEFFQFAGKNIRSTKIFSYERVFPAFLASRLPLELTQRMSAEILELFLQDPEMYATIRVFLENNLNASLTAKKLYIHRNTLQYRLDKFVEKTGIGLKDFYGAFTVFLTCQLYEQQK